MAKNPKSQSTVVSRDETLRDHLAWSLFNFAYMNFCCLGFLALVFSVKSRDRKHEGDYEGARYFAKRAKIFNIVAAVLSILVIIIVIALAGVGMFHSVKVSEGKHYDFTGNGGLKRSDDVPV